MNFSNFNLGYVWWQTDKPNIDGELGRGGQPQERIVIGEIEIVVSWVFQLG
jgi:hypothetical protein